MRMETAIILDNPGLFQNHTCQLIGRNCHIPVAAHGRRMRDNVLIGVVIE
jgi:hypothetical protein